MPDASSRSCTLWKVRTASARMMADALGSMAHCDNGPNNPQSPTDGRPPKK